MISSFVSLLYRLKARERVDGGSLGVGPLNKFSTPVRISLKYRLTPFPVFGHKYFFAINVHKILHFLLKNSKTSRHSWFYQQCTQVDCSVDAAKSASRAGTASTADWSWVMLRWCALKRDDWRRAIDLSGTKWSVIDTSYNYCSFRVKYCHQWPDAFQSVRYGQSETLCQSVNNIIHLTWLHLSPFWSVTVLALFHIIRWCVALLVCRCFNHRHYIGKVAGFRFAVDLLWTNRFWI